jgi:glutamyl-Q tRNA(Asp) synthetase
VRGADLLNSTARQIYLQRLLGLPTPAYMHLPVVVNEQGEKLSKQTLARAVDAGKPAETLIEALQLLRQQPPAELIAATVEDILAWATMNWKPETLSRLRQFDQLAR